MNKELIVIIGIIWVGLFILGWILGFFYDRRDNKLKSKKIYRVSIINHIAKLNIPIHFLLISVGIFTLGILASLMLFKGIYVPGLIGTFLIVCAGILGYYSFLAILLHIQYYKTEKSRIIEFDPKQRIMYIKSLRDNSIISLQEKNIQNVEFHYSSGNLRRPTTEYEFIKITSESNPDIIVTSLQTKLLNLDDFFRVRNRRNFYNKVNWLK